MKNILGDMKDMQFWLKLWFAWSLPIFREDFFILGPIAPQSSFLSIERS